MRQNHSCPPDFVFEAQMRLWRGAEGHMSYALQEAIDQATGEILPNSPRHMGKARVFMVDPEARTITREYETDVQLA